MTESRVIVTHIVSRVGVSRKFCFDYMDVICRVNGHSYIFDKQELQMRQ